MAKQISEGRKAAYYLGGIIMGLGFILFASTFVSAALHFGDFSNFESQTRSMIFRALGGMALIVIGGIVRGIGARGLAGSGVVLDPEQARDELKPYSRMAGGMVKDMLDEADIHLGGKPERIVMIKCQACGKLNEEDSRFCQECGQKL